MIHAMNFYSLKIDDRSSRIFEESYISEVPTHIIENLLGKWLIKNKLITQNRTFGEQLLLSPGAWRLVVTL